MSQQSGRYTAASSPNLAEGWTLDRLTQPSRLFGANGMRTGADGRIYVAQVAGSQVSAIDIDTGVIEAISPKGGAIVGPDDLVFDEEGNLYVTEITENQVRMLAPNGTSRVICDNMPVANPITYYQGRLIAGECRIGARIMELDRNGGAPRVIIDNVPMANAFDVGPDGKLYFPVMGTNEIWRVSLDGGAPEVVAKDLGVPDSVKFDPQGNIISTQVASGQVLRIDPRTGDKTVLADIGPGLDNSTFVGNRLFVSHITGSIHEILEPGKIRPLVEKGLQWPMGLAEGVDGTLFVADGGFTYTLPRGGNLELAGLLFTPGFPGFTRGVAAGSAAGEWIVTTANGDVTRWRPAEQKHEVLANGYDKLMGVAVASGGAVVFAESGTGRVLVTEGGATTVLASGLNKPVGVAVGSDGTCYVADAGAGKVVKLSRGKAETVLDGLKQPEGIAFHNGKLYILDVFTKELIECDVATRARRTIAANLPVGVPPGVVLKYLGAVGDMCGPMVSFADVAAGADGTLYVAGDAEGCVLAIRPV
jgi:sugar lactone lactonase YvrE